MKVKLTKGELKKQRDALKQYSRYLPTLQLKKQQLQLEILGQYNLLSEQKKTLEGKKVLAQAWAGLLAEPGINFKPWLNPSKVISGVKNVAGVDIPVFHQLDFTPVEYDLFLVPLWMDAAIDQLRGLVSLQEEIKVIEKGIAVLKRELRVTSQRVNLFEKVKIPATEETIRVIKIYIGDQMANAVGRSKMAKSKIETSALEEVML